MAKTLLACCGVALAVSGCAVHPLPENIQPYNTGDIVQHIRCEARRSIEENAIALLRDPMTSDADKALATELENDPARFKTLTVDDIPSTLAKNFYLKYINSGIAYNYTFDIMEENNNNAEIDFGRVLTANTLSLKLTGRANLARDANRQFIVTDTFGELIASNYCDTTGRLPPNLAYPIAGEIGLRETISTFIRLNEEDILKIKKDDNGGEILYSDQLKFTTVYGGSVNPTLTINPTSTFKLTQALANSEVIRTDMNQVIIGLSLGKKEDVKSSKRIKRVAARSGPFGVALVTGNVAEGSEARAIDATVQNRVNSFLNNFGTLRIQ